MGKPSVIGARLRLVIEVGDNPLGQLDELREAVRLMQSTLPPVAKLFLDEVQFANNEGYQ